MKLKSSLKYINLFCLMCSFLFCSCDVDSNNYNTIIDKYVSPDKKYVSYYFSRDLGATTAKSYQLRIEKNGDTLSNSVGNIFVSSKPFSFKWIDCNNVLIIYDDSSEVYKNEKEYDYIKIEYKKKK